MQKCFTIGISSRALFDLEKEHEIFETQGTEAYVSYQIDHEREVLDPGLAFGLIRSFLCLNEQMGKKQIEVVIMSKNSADAGMRVFHSISHYGLDISRAAFTSGGAIAPYLKAYGVDLYLSFNGKDVRDAVLAGVAAGVLLPGAGTVGSEDEDLGVQAAEKDHPEQIRIAFDGDAVLFSGDSQRIFDEEGVEAFCRNEQAMAAVPLSPGPFAHVLQLISRLQKQAKRPLIRTALVTARSAPAHERVIRTLQTWDIRVDEAFFMGGMDKRQVLQAFGANIFFDDSEENVASASTVVLAARVPWVDDKRVS